MWLFHIDTYMYLDMDTIINLNKNHMQIHRYVMWAIHGKYDGLNKIQTSN
jgi:hypothetical protein